MRHFHSYPTRHRGLKIAGFGILAICLGVALAGLFGAAVQHLWNYVMPAVFHLPAISFLQAAALLILGRLLFGRIGGHGRHWGHRFHGRYGRRQGPSPEAYERWWRGRGGAASPEGPGAAE